MPIPTHHTVEISGTPNVVYPFEAKCSCQWQALGHNYAEAEWYGKNHAGMQRARGNTATLVTLVKPPTGGENEVSGPVGSVEKAGEGDANKTEAPTAT